MTKKIAKPIYIINGIYFMVLMAVPMTAEFMTATVDKVPGTGFSVLLYQPFYFAYVLLAGIIFVVLNTYWAVKNTRSIFYGSTIGLALLIIWFIVTFLSVGQLHLSLGGKL